MSLPPSRLYRSIISPGIAEIYSNVKVLPGFFPVDLSQRHDQKPVSPPEACVTFLVKKELPRRQSHAGLGFGSMYGEPQENTLHRIHTLVGSVKAKIEISGLHDHPTISINRTYYRFGRLQIGNFCPPGVHVRDVLQVLLIGRGYVPLHSSAFAASGQGILVAGPPDIGKTPILIQAMKQGFQYLADDLTIADGDGYLHPSPGISSFAYELGEMPKSHRRRDVRFWKIGLLDFLSRKTPLAGILFERPYIDVGSFIQQPEIASKAKVRHIFILARGSPRVEKLSASEALRMLVPMNRLELTYHENQMLIAYSLLNPWFNLSELIHTEETLLQNLIANSTCFLCVAPSPDEHFALIQQNI